MSFCAEGAYNGLVVLDTLCVTVDTPLGNKFDPFGFKLFVPSSLFVLTVGVTSKNRDMHALLKLTPILCKEELSNVLFYAITNLPIVE